MPSVFWPDPDRAFLKSYWFSELALRWDLGGRQLLRYYAIAGEGDFLVAGHLSRLVGNVTFSEEFVSTSVGNVTRP